VTMNFTFPAGTVDLSNLMSHSDTVVVTVVTGPVGSGSGVGFGVEGVDGV